MTNNRYKDIFKRWLLCLFILLVGSLGTGFAVSLINLFNQGFIFDNQAVLTAIIVGIITTLSTLTVSFYITNKDTIFKFLFIVEIALSVIIIAFYILQSVGFWDKIDSIEDLREYVASFGAYAVLVFILIQILQVVILPLPSFITIGAGVLSFGAFWGAVYSYVGILIGSITAYFLGKTFGYKLAVWLFGKKKLETWIKRIKGKGKILITFMFLFPFFPDDLLCFVSGITIKDNKFFIVMTSIVRLITVFSFSYSLNNSLIPYDTWWGIVLWAIFFVLTISIASLIFKRSNNILYKLRNIRKNQKKTK